MTISKILNIVQDSNFKEFILNFKRSDKATDLAKICVFLC